VAFVPGLCAFLGRLSGSVDSKEHHWTGKVSGMNQRNRMHAALSQLDNVTLGDFATVARRYHVLGQHQDVDPEAIIEALPLEHAMKPEAGKRRAGFA